MNVKKQIKNYYRSRVEVQKVPPLDERLQKRIEPAGSEKRKRTLVFDLVFHAGIIVFLVLILAVNSSTSKSLQRLDPDNQKSHVVQAKIEQGLNKIKAYLRPNPVPVK